MSNWLCDQLAKIGSPSSRLLDLNSKELGSNSNFTLTSVRWEYSSSSAARLIVPESSICAIHNRLGSLCFSTPSRGVLGLAPPNSVALVQPGVYHLLGSRGSHEAMYLANREPAPHHLREFLIRGSSPVSVRSCHLGLQWHTDQLSRFWEETAAPSYFETLAVSFGLIAHFETSGSEVDFAPLRSELSSTLKNVCDQVLEKPGEDWTTKRGAETAGYSQYHFSRVFKQSLGYGFHDFVERIRLNIAVSAFLTNPISGWEASGFKTQNALRDALRIHTGFSLAELNGSLPTGAYVREHSSGRYS